MMDLTPCLLAQPNNATEKQVGWIKPCTGPNASAAHLVESTLRQLQPNIPETPAWQLGYTLKVPLLALLQPKNNDWQINRQAIDNIV